MPCQKVPYNTKAEAKQDIKDIKIQQKFRSKNSGLKSLVIKQRQVERCMLIFVVIVRNIIYRQ